MAINLKDDIKPISYIKTNAADMMKYVNDHKNSIIITQNGEAKAVLVDIESYQSMKAAFSLMKMLKLSEQNVKAGQFKASDEVFSQLKDRYQKK
jgi:prevent-host-death family protein